MSTCKQHQYEGPRSADRSDRISKLALPNLHVVSSVLKEHFRTLRKDQIERLEKLIKQIQENRAPSASQLSFIKTLNNFKGCNQKGIFEVLGGIDTNASTPRIHVELSQVRLLPVKSSSDTFLMGLSKQISCNTNNKNDKSAIDLSTSLSALKAFSKKAFSSMNWNYKETVLIKVEGLPKTDVERNSKSVQTENSKSEVEEECAQDVSVLYVHTSNFLKKPKLRQLHTLLESSDTLQNKMDCECQTDTSNKSDRSLRVELNDDVKITINHLCTLYVLIITYLNCIMSALQIFYLSLQNRYYELKPYIEEIPNVLYDVSLDLKTQFVQLSLEVYDKIQQALYRRNLEEYVREVESEKPRRKKKKKNYCTETFHFSNIRSILH